MDDIIIVRNSELGTHLVSSAYITLCGGREFSTVDSLISHFGIKTVMAELYCDQVDNSSLENSNLYAHYVQAQAKECDNEFFFQAYKLDDEYAVTISQNIYLHKLVPKTDDVCSIVTPWYYQYGKMHIGDTWWFQNEEVLSDVQSLPLIQLFKKYKGF